MAASPLCISFDFQFVSVHGNECCCPAFLGRGGGHVDEGLVDEDLVEGEVTELFDFLNVDASVETPALPLRHYLSEPKRQSLDCPPPFSY
jgi:hypothetical protein